tara:strand:+ start:130 stop:372 length:243 start_codon:yes stop_codon:yes gene_type:complete
MGEAFTLIGKTDCMACSKASGLIRDRGGVVNYYAINKAKWIVDLMKKANIMTVPQIWNEEGKYIGGYDDLVKYLYKGDKG